MIVVSAQNFPPGSITPGYQPRLSMHLTLDDLATIEKATKELRDKAAAVSPDPAGPAQIVSARAGDVFVTLEVQRPAK